LALWVCPSAINASELLSVYPTCPDGGWCNDVCPDDPTYLKVDPGRVGEAEEGSYYYYGYMIDSDGAFVACVNSLRAYATAIAGGENTTGTDYATHTADPKRAAVDNALNSNYNPFTYYPKATCQTDINNGLTTMGLPLGTIAQGTGGADNLMKMKEGAERFLITDINNPAGSAKAQSETAAMWDRIVYSQVTQRYRERFNHLPGGSNILYMDGHVEFKKYSSSNTFPISPLQGYWGRL
jgi:prepilin-type processing-associated H-X9-DG protein